VANNKLKYMETSKVVRTSASKLAVELVQTQRQFKKQCLEFGVKFTPSMDLAYESGFGAALIVMGIEPGGAEKMNEIADEIRETIKKENSNTLCDCADCRQGHGV